jgi:hypothetical protein
MFCEELALREELPFLLASIEERIMEFPAILRVLVGGFPDEAPPAHLEVFCLARLSELRLDFTPPDVPGFFWT